MYIELIGMIASAALGGLMGAIFGNYKANDQLAYYQTELDRSKRELAAANRVIEAQEYIHQRFEQRLTDQFSRLTESDDRADIAPIAHQIEPKQPKIKHDGVLTYEVFH